jgi:hypothetical protein
VYRQWDGLNGRYYFVADVFLDDGSVRRDVTFDSDKNVAVEIARRRVWEVRELMGKQVIQLLRVRRPGGTEQV